MNSQPNVKAAEGEATVPILSICIPTYNRAANLSQCLHSIFSQIGDTALIEVDVSDNASTDGTDQIVQWFLEKYSNLRYTRNAENIGADRNILQLTNAARGTFIKLQGDDDFFVPGSIWPLVEVIRHNADCGVIHVNVLSGEGIVIRGEGAATYLAHLTYNATFLTALILRQEDWNKLEDKELFIDSSLNHLYLQFAVLTGVNPKYAIYNYSMFTYAGNVPNGYRLAEVFIRGYLNILGYFVGKGFTEEGSLTEEAIKRDKELLLRNYLMRTYRDNLPYAPPEFTAGFEEVFTEYYGEEPYYEEILAWFRSLD